MLISLGSLGVYAPTVTYSISSKPSSRVRVCTSTYFFSLRINSSTSSLSCFSAESLSSKSAITALSSCCSASYFSKKLTQICSGILPMTLSSYTDCIRFSSSARRCLLSFSFLMSALDWREVCCSFLERKAALAVCSSLTTSSAIERISAIITASICF